MDMLADSSKNGAEPYPPVLKNEMRMDAKG
jgi:hypothetical protein